MVAILAAAAVAAGCTEKLESGGACPALCPSQDVDIRDTTIDAVVTQDTSVAAFPIEGREHYLLVAHRPDTLESWAVLRFDTLPTTYKNPDSTRTLTTVRNARLRLWVDTTGVRGNAPVLIRAYDVDTTAADDSSLTTIQALRRSDRLIGSVTRNLADIKDTLSIPLSDSAIGAKTASGGRLRVLLTAESAGSAQVRFAAWELAESTLPAVLFNPPADRDSTDTVKVITSSSATPTGEGARPDELYDYNLAVQRTPVLQQGTIAIGGMPGTRALLRFGIPRRFADSVTVIRATLILTQLAASGSVDRTDSVTVVPLINLASTEILDRDPLRSASLVSRVVFSSLDSVSVAEVKVTPGSSGERTFEVARLLRYWRLLGAGRTQAQPQALVLQMLPEGSTGQHVLFHSSESATVSARPRLRIQYISRVEFGLP